MNNLKEQVWNATRYVTLTEVDNLFWREAYRERLARVRMAMCNQVIEEIEN